MTDGMRWRGALYGLASSAREGRGGHMIAGRCRRCARRRSSQRAEPSYFIQR